jgi:ribosome-binding protein aMBF1 (putative translation factor)
MSSHDISPIGQTHTEARKRRRRSPAYAQAAKELAPYEALARLVIRFRMDNGLRQEDLAAMINTSHSAISRLESGQHRPSVETLEKLAQAFKRQLVIGFAEPFEAETVDAVHATVADHDADLVVLA